MGTTFERVRDFLAEECRVPPAQITLKTRLLHDLGIDADDASEILLRFSERFNVDLTPLAFSRHFGPELDAGPRWLVRKLFGTNAELFAPIKIQDLIDAADRGRWIEN
jgi:acyl carrier protein